MSDDEEKKASSLPKNPDLQEPEEEILREKEIEEKARKRSRGPYRKANITGSESKRV